MKLYYRFFILAFAIFISGCGSKENSYVSHSPFKFVENYFQSEITTLQRSGKPLKKSIFRDSHSESEVLSNPDWKKELSVFVSRVTDKRNFENSFKLDSVTKINQKILNYTARDKSVEIQQLSVYQTNLQIDSIYIVTFVSNMYYTASDTLHYSGNGNYRISATDKPVIGKEIRFVLTGNTP